MLSDCRLIRQCRRYVKEGFLLPVEVELRIDTVDYFLFGAR